MGIFNRKKPEPAVQVPEERYNLGSLNFNMLSSYNSTKSTRLSAVYGATNMISNSVAVLPINIFKYENGKKMQVQHQLDNILSNKPDNKHTPYNFLKLLVESVILKGNGYALIQRDSNLNVTALIPIRADMVQPQLQKDGSVKYIVAGLSKAVNSDDIINLYQHIDDTFRGISTISYAVGTLTQSAEAEKHSENFFKSGANLSGIIKANQTLNNEQKQQIKDSWTQAFNSDNNKVSVAVLPSGLEFQSVSISPKDSMLLDTRKFNVVEICRFFNISPIKLFDLQYSNNNMMEQTQISYAKDTIEPYLKMIEDEFNNKLFKPSERGKYKIEFDSTSLLTTDKKSEADYFKTLLVNGIMSLNEVRNKIGLAPIADGDNHFMQLSYTSLDNILNGTVNNPPKQVE